MKDPTPKQLAFLVAASEAGGGITRGSAPWLGAAAENVVESLLRDDFVTQVETTTGGGPRRVELNLRGREAVTASQQLMRGLIPMTTPTARHLSPE